MSDKKLINVSAEEIARLLNKDALRLIDRLRIDIVRLLDEIIEAEINISYMHAYKPLLKILVDCNAYDKKLEAMGIYMHKALINANVHISNYEKRNKLTKS